MKLYILVYNYWDEKKTCFGYAERRFFWWKHTTKKDLLKKDSPETIKSDKSDSGDSTLFGVLRFISRIFFLLQREKKLKENK